METTTQEIIYQVIMLIVSGILAVLGAYAKKYITTKIDIAKYGFENDRVERIIDNAISFAEQRAKVAAKGTARDGVRHMDGSTKLAIAKQYIDKVDRAVVTKYATQLDDMIDRKVAQKFGA